MMPIEPDHYGVLELEPGSPMEDVKSQYRRLAKRWHPDLHGNDARSQEQFRRVNTAYAFLSDAPRKEAYDACLEAARKIGAPPLREAPPSAAGYHSPVTATGFHALTPSDVRMTRSAWLGATAGAIVVLLVIGLSLDGSSSRRPLAVENTSPALDVAPSNAQRNEARDEAKLRDEAESRNESKPAAVLPSASPQVFSHRLSPGIPAPLAPLPPKRVSHADVPLVFHAGDRVETVPLPGKADPVLPRADSLLNRDYAVRASPTDAEDGARRIFRDRPAVDRAELSATRARVRPAFARLSRQGTSQDMQQKAGPIRADLRRLQDARQPVRDDIKALSSPAFRFVPPPPARTPSIVPAAPPPVPPAPSAAAPAPEAPKPAEKSATKPKPPASSGQEFIMWGE